MAEATVVKFCTLVHAVLHKPVTELNFFHTLTCVVLLACMVQASEVIHLLGLEDTAQSISTMSPVSLLVCSSLRPVVSHRLPSHFQVSAETFFENKHGRFRWGK